MRFIGRLINDNMHLILFFDDWCQVSAQRDWGGCLRAFGSDYEKSMAVGDNRLRLHDPRRELSLVDCC